MKKITATVLAGMLTAGAVVAEEGRRPHAMEAMEAKEAKLAPQTTCPVLGGKIDKDLYVDHDGKRVYVCCKGCIAAVKKEPQKYIKKLEADGITVMKVQTTCPVMGGKVNRDLYVDHDGQRIYVCCKGCLGAVRKNPEKYIKKLAEKGEVPASVPEKTKHEDAKKPDGAQTGHEGHPH